MAPPPHQGGVRGGLPSFELTWHCPRVAREGKPLLALPPRQAGSPWKGEGARQSPPLPSEHLWRFNNWANERRFFSLRFCDYLKKIASELLPVANRNNRSAVLVTFDAKSDWCPAEGLAKMTLNAQIAKEGKPLLTSPRKGEGAMASKIVSRETIWNPNHKFSLTLA